MNFGDPSLSMHDEEALRARLDAAELRAAAAEARLTALGLEGDVLPSWRSLRESYVQFVLGASGRNISKTARILKLDRRTLYRYFAVAKKLSRTTGEKAVYGEPAAKEPTP